METNDICEILKEEIYNSGVPIEEISRKSGIAASTIRRWCHDRNTASLENAQYVLSVIGKELVIKEKIENAQ